MKFRLRAVVILVTLPMLASCSRSTTSSTTPALDEDVAPTKTNAHPASLDTVAKDVEAFGQPVVAPATKAASKRLSDDNDVGDVRNDAGVVQNQKGDDDAHRDTKSLSEQFDELVNLFREQRSRLAKGLTLDSRSEPQDNRKRETEAKFARNAVDRFRDQAADPEFLHVATWAFQHADDDCVADVIETIKTHHAHSPKLPEALIALLQSSTPSSLSFLHSIANESSNEKLKQIARLVLANRLDEQHDREKIIGLLDSVINYEGELEIPNFNVKDNAEARMFGLTKLAVGQVAPDIQGVDDQGKLFKLSDYRGKVVLLDFWGDWCGSCQAMYAQGRSLVEKYKDRPFALLGVNADRREDVPQIVERKNITWRSWCDDSPNGDISTAWRIRQFPSVFLLDHEGVIQFKDVEDNELDVAIEKLVLAAETTH